MHNGTAGCTTRWAFARTLSLAAALSLVASLAAARRPPRHAASPPQPDGGGTPAPLAGPAAAPSDIQTLLAAADDITRQVAALRGLQVRRPIERGVLSRDQIGERLRERIAKEYTPEEIRAEARVLKRLGLLPADADYQRLLLDLLMEQVAGFYDPDTRRLYIADWLAIELQRPALAHEIEHALQDQHFDLKTFAAPIKDEGDRQLARAALVEGDGMAAMVEFFAQSLGLDVASAAALRDSLGKQLGARMRAQSPVSTRAPRFLRETLHFPYVAGFNFVLALRKSQWSKVDEAFRDPPESTEQVLHPERYFAREHPVKVSAAPIAALAPRKELRRDVLGELALRLLLEVHLPDGTAERAAEGWGGDRLVAYGDDSETGKVVVVDLSTWDSEDDAREAEAALRQFMARQVTGRDAKGTEPPRNGPVTFETGGESWSVERRARKVLALFGVPAGLRQAVADEVWSSWKVADGAVAASEKSTRNKAAKQPPGR